MIHVTLMIIIMPGSGGNCCVMVNLYIIDDHYLIVEGLYYSFNPESDDFTVVGGSLTIADAMIKIPNTDVDIIILDLFINQTDPVINLGLIRKKFPEIPVVILSQENSLMWQAEMFLHGVKAFLAKSEDKSILCQKLQRVSTGETVMPNEVTEIIMKGDQKVSKLISDDLKEILGYIMKGLVTKEIAAKMHQSESSIEKKLKKLREMHKVRNNHELILKCCFKKLPYNISRRMH